jgi:hypothetical protein
VCDQLLTGETTMAMRRTSDLTPGDRARLEAEARARGGTVTEVLLPGWAAFYLEERERLEALHPGGCMPPIAVACTGGAMLAVAIAPRVDRDLGLHAARVLLATADPDEVWLGLETTGARHDRELSDEEFSRTYPRGRLQRLAELGFSGEGTNVVELISVFRVTRDGTLDTAALPYERAVPARGRPFAWLAGMFHFTDVKACPGDAPAAHVGVITDALREYAAAPRMADHPEVVAYRAAAGWDPARSLPGSTRAGLRLLRRLGFGVVDILTRDHPEARAQGWVPVDEEPEGYEPGEVDS